MVNGRLGYLGGVNVTVTGGGGNDHAIDPSTVPTGHVMVSDGTGYVAAPLHDARLPASASAQSILLSDGTNYAETPYLFNTTLPVNSVAIGASSGFLSTAGNVTALGHSSGLGAKTSSIAIGASAGANALQYSTVVGTSAGTGAGLQATCVGYNSGNGVGTGSTTLGAYSGTGSTGSYVTAVGRQAGTNADRDSTCLGFQSGNGAGIHSLSLGNLCSAVNPNSIALSAEVTAFTSDRDSALFITPIARPRDTDDAVGDILIHNQATKEVVRVNYEELKLQSVDPHVSRYIAAVQPRHDYQKTAYRDLILRLKADGLWMKLKRAYLFPSTNPTIDLIDDANTVDTSGRTWKCFEDGLHLTHWAYNTENWFLPFNASTDIGDATGLTVFDAPMMDMETVNFQWGSYVSATSALATRYRSGTGLNFRAYNGDLRTNVVKSEEYQEYCMSILKSTGEMSVYRNNTLVEEATSAITTVMPNWNIALGGLSTAADTIGYDTQYRTSHWVAFEFLTPTERTTGYQALVQLKRDLRLPEKNGAIAKNIVLHGNSITEHRNTLLYRSAFYDVPLSGYRFSYCGRGGNDMDEMLADMNAAGREADLYRPTAHENIIINFEVVNTLQKHFLADEPTCVANTLSAIAGWVAGVKALGYDKVLVANMIMGRKLSDVTITRDPWYFHVDTVNQTMIANAGGIYGDHVIDMTSEEFYRPRADFQTDTEYLDTCDAMIADPSYYTNDGVHINTPGSEAAGAVMGRRLVNLIT